MKVSSLNKNGQIVEYDVILTYHSTKYNKHYMIYTENKYDEKGDFHHYVLVNPKIISTSVELTYLETGEGCLSVNRDVEGIVPRYARVTIEGYDMEGRKIHIRAREDLAICFQHEIDHLNGILFTDKIDPKEPFKNKDKYRAL